MSRHKIRPQSGFTLVELLAVLAILGLLMALLLPAVLQAREAARRVQCAANLKQFGTAIHNFEAVHCYFPSGGDRGVSLHVRLLPFIDQTSLYGRIDWSVLQPGTTLLTGQSLDIPLFNCPSDSESGGSGTNYVGNTGTGVQTYGFNGLFRYLAAQYWGGGPEHFRPRDAVDGLSNTALMSERLVDREGTDRRTLWRLDSQRERPDELEKFAELCGGAGPATAEPHRRILGRLWTDGSLVKTLYNHVLPPNRPTCSNGSDQVRGCYPAASLHRSGVQLLLADGAVRFASQNINRLTWRALGSRAGSEAATSEW